MSENNPNGGFLSFIGDLIQGVFRMVRGLFSGVFSWISGLFGGQSPAPAEGPAPSLSQDVQSRWRALQQEYHGQTPIHTNPLKVEALITSGFGQRDTHALPAGASAQHHAIDLIPARRQSGPVEVYATAEAVVLESGTRAGNGHYVRLGYTDGSTGYYLHLAAEAQLTPGARIHQGDAIGIMGNSGLPNMGAHLDYRQYDADGKPMVPVIGGVQYASAGAHIGAQAGADVLLATNMRPSATPPIARSASGLALS